MHVLKCEDLYLWHFCIRNNETKEVIVHSYKCLSYYKFIFSHLLRLTYIVQFIATLLLHKLPKEGMNSQSW